MNPALDKINKSYAIQEMYSIVVRNNMDGQIKEPFLASANNLAANDVY